MDEDLVQGKFVGQLIYFISPQTRIVVHDGCATVADLRTISSKSRDISRTMQLVYYVHKQSRLKQHLHTTNRINVPRVWAHEVRGSLMTCCVRSRVRSRDLRCRQHAVVTSEATRVKRVISEKNRADSTSLVTVQFSPVDDSRFRFNDDAEVALFGTGTADQTGSWLQRSWHSTADLSVYTRTAGPLAS